MVYETTLIYSAPLLQKAMFGFCRRSLGIGYLVAVLATGLGFFGLLARGDASWFVGALGGVFALGMLGPAAIYVVHYKNALNKFREMGNARTTFRAEESSFTVTSAIGTSTIEWSAVKELWQFRDVWLLMYSKQHYSTLPLASIPPEMRAFIQERVQTFGGKVY